MYMKKKISVYYAALALGLLTGCNASNNTDTTTAESKTPAIPAERKKEMTRTKTASGLEYEILEEGSGASPVKGKPVTVHYTGWLDNNGQKGTKFDSSVDRGMPFTFSIGVGQVIKGWDEGVMSMKVGEKRRLIIPAALGYGARGAGGIIPPNATLIFDVELLKVS